MIICQCVPTSLDILAIETLHNILDSFKDRLCCRFYLNIYPNESITLRQEYRLNFWGSGYAPSWGFNELHESLERWFLQELHVWHDALHNEACDMIWSKSKNMWNHLKTYETSEPGETIEKLNLIIFIYRFAFYW